MHKFDKPFNCRVISALATEYLVTVLIRYKGNSV